jgi:hypothetical protein
MSFPDKLIAVNYVHVISIKSHIFNPFIYKFINRQNRLFTGLVSW